MDKSQAASHFEGFLDFDRSECQLLHMDVLLEAHLPPAAFNNSNQSLPPSGQTEGGDGAQCRLASRLVRTTTPRQVGRETQNWNRAPAAPWKTLWCTPGTANTLTHSGSPVGVSVLLKDTLTVAGSLKLKFVVLFLLV